MIRKIIHYVNYLKTQSETLINCLLSGLPFDRTWKLSGRIVVIRRSRLSRLFHSVSSGDIIIGKKFLCANKVKANSIGLIQPCVFNVSTSKSKIEIGNNVGISGSTINATKSITIGNNVLIGSGCLITDTDSHPLHWEDRLKNDNAKTKSAPIRIEDNVFIGARSIILKGVTIGEGSVVGAGSVVSQDVPPFVVVCGNPAKIVKSLKNDKV